MGWTILEWLLGHPAGMAVALAAAVGMFFLWLFAPFQSGSSDGSIVIDGEKFADLISSFFD